MAQGLTNLSMLIIASNYPENIMITHAGPGEAYCEECGDVISRKGPDNWGAGRCWICDEDYQM